MMNVNAMAGRIRGMNGEDRLGYCEAVAVLEGFKRGTKAFRDESQRILTAILNVIHEWELGE